MASPLTQHAAARLQQRAIPVLALDLLWEFGSTARSRGADNLFFDRAARQRLARTLGHEGLRRIHKLTNAYAVVADDGTVITAGWRTQRRHRA